MTVSSQTNKIVYQGNGATTAFPFAFAIPGGLTVSLAAADLTVTYIDTNGNSTVLSYGPSANNYQLVINPPISPNPTGVGGTVSYNPSGNPIALGTSLVIERTLPSVQGTSFQNQGTLWQQAIEQSLDYLTMLEQDIAATISLAIQAPLSDPASLNYVVPAVASRANKLLGFDANGNVVAISGTAPVGPPVGQQTITSTWTFEGSPPIVLESSSDCELRFIDLSSNTPYYTGTISGGSGTTVTLSANPTNIITNNPCCTNDSTIANACVIVNGGGATQVALINTYNASTGVITITGNVYNMAGVLIGANFSPTPQAGYTYSIGRFDYGYSREVAFHFLQFTQFWNLPNPAAGGAAAPFSGGDFSSQRFNRLTSETNFTFSITGIGAVAPFYISPNSVWNGDATPQPPVNLAFYTLQSSGDTGNTGNFPSSFPVTYQYYPAMEIVPHAYSGGVLTSFPYIWTNNTVNFGVGTAGKPDSQLEVRNNASASKTPPTGTLGHFVGANSTAAIELVDGYAGIPQVILRRANGSAGSESAILNTNFLGEIGAFGYGATGYSASYRALILFEAAENWSDTAQGAHVIFGTTPTGTASNVEAGRFWASGGLSIGTATDPGTGGVHAAGSITGATFNPIGVTVGTLPSPLAGMIAFVSNGPNAPSWGQAVSAGGTPELVWYNGTQWKVLGV